jgi:maleylacetoacetate isomerase
MKLYTYFRSSTSYRVRIAMAYKGIGYEPRFVSLPKAEHTTSEYKAVNPVGLVPSLDLDGRILTQSLAIMEYLEEVQPEPRLLPKDPFDRAYVRALSQIIACEIHPLNNLRTLNFVRDTYGQDKEGLNRWYRHWIAEGFRMMEDLITREKRYGKYSCGDQVSMADCCLVPQVANAQRYQCDLSAYPTVMRIHEALIGLPAFVQASPEKQPDAV